MQWHSEQRIGIIDEDRDGKMILVSRFVSLSVCIEVRFPIFFEQGQIEANERSSKPSLALLAVHPCPSLIVSRAAIAVIVRCDVQPYVASLTCPLVICLRVAPKLHVVPTCLPHPLCALVRI